MKMLVAEDNRASRVLLEKLLKTQGHEVFSAEDGKEALDLYDVNDIDMAFIDWMMPKMDGIELATEIRKLKPEKKPYLIMVTSKSGEENMLTALEAGLDDFIIKPIDSAVLLSRINVGERMQKELPLDAITILNDEHEVIKRMLRIFKAIANSLGNVEISKTVLEWCGSTAVILDTEVHHKKEDYFIMAFLERALKEHGESPKSRIFSRASLKTIEDEHKELEILMADIQLKIQKYIEKAPGSDQTLKVTLKDYINLLQEHMEREDKLLFPLSRKYLTEEDMGLIITAFDKVEKEVGVDKLERRMQQIVKAEKALKIDPK
jgi:CheY-like chemotaxis protein